LETKHAASLLRFTDVCANVNVGSSLTRMGNDCGLASLTLLAHYISQDRYYPNKDQSSDELASSLVYIINHYVTHSETALNLPSNSESFYQILISAKILSPNSTLLTVALPRILPLAMGVMSVGKLHTLSKGVDAISALSVERIGVADPKAYDSVLFDTLRPHRGLIRSASVLRVILEGSKSPANNATSQENKESCVDTAGSPVVSIPSIHGYAIDAIAASYKTLELELNCCESLNGQALDMTLVGLNYSQVLNAGVALLDASRDRSVWNLSNETPDVTTAAPSMTELNSLASLASNLYETSRDLHSSLVAEIKAAYSYIQTQSAQAILVQTKKADEKAARAAAMTNKTTTDDDAKFAGMSDAQKEKILKKRAEKEAKAAAKLKAKLAKQGKTTGATNAGVFANGTLQICSAIAPTFSSSSETTPDIILNATTSARIEAVIDTLLSGGVQRKPKIPKGTRDYLPDQMSIRQQAFDIIRRVFLRHGAVEIDTPVFERKETLTGKYGEDSKLIYDLADQGGELLALRYDLTVPFARFLALNNVGNIKRFHIGKVYRRDQPQLAKGRYREFYQCDFDIAGSSYGRMIPDAECLCVAIEILDALPIGDFQIKVNHRCLLDAILELAGVPPEKFRVICSAVDKLDKEPWSEVKREMVDEKGLKSEVADKIGEFVLQKGPPMEMLETLLEAKQFGTHVGASTALEDMRICFRYLKAMDKLHFLSFDLSLARGLDYYTGIIYEAVCMNGNTQVGSIGGGGRYDNLVSMFQEAGKQTPCVGVSVGIERVFTLMEARIREEQGGSIKRPNVNVLVASVGQNMMEHTMAVTKRLWDANVSAEFSPLENRKLKFELANALEREIPFMVICGEDEWKEGMCKVKDLKNKTEETVKVEDVAKILRGKGVVPVGCEFAAELMKEEDK